MCTALLVSCGHQIDKTPSTPTNSGQVQTGQTETPQKNTESEKVLYKNDELGFTLTLPESWNGFSEKSEKIQDATFYNIDFPSGGEAFSFRSISPENFKKGVECNEKGEMECAINPDSKIAELANGDYLLLNISGLIQDKPEKAEKYYNDLEASGDIKSSEFSKAVKEYVKNNIHIDNSAQT